MHHFDLRAVQQVRIKPPKVLGRAAASNKRSRASRCSLGSFSLLSGYGNMAAAAAAAASQHPALGSVSRTLPPSVPLVFHTRSCTASRSLPPSCLSSLSLPPARLHVFFLPGLSASLAPESLFFSPFVSFFLCLPAHPITPPLRDGISLPLLPGISLFILLYPPLSLLFPHDTALRPPTFDREGETDTRRPCVSGRVVRALRLLRAVVLLSSSDCSIVHSLLRATVRVVGRETRIARWRIKMRARETDRRRADGGGRRQEVQRAGSQRKIRTDEAGWRVRPGQTRRGEPHGYKQSIESSTRRPGQPGILATRHYRVSTAISLRRVPLSSSLLLHPIAYERNSTTMPREEQR